ncbi:hypothetical protein Thimo_0795 [Thioflavicoccus mobilis 8321]|uniref:Phage tail protein (Tail_P2_I) n=1 Tax=Thioflavicoccus mobilis 8321 TaxID=765912 RepID=L0GWF9_9GAMM|nr:hypothetical protein [Thioflavicoccus mobilis]AGA89634.1 hypothetical protein Thimo_0795 [Thioflavicoccus mobilis 8321]
MNLDAETLLRLLPAIHRLRDAETAAALGNGLTPAEAAELAALEALTSPDLVEQERLAELRERATRGPLAALLAAFAGEFAVVEENLAQLYDDLFIETCADWVVPYIGDLIGYEPLHEHEHGQGQDHAPARAEVAHTIALRRRKGTATALEQIAADVTGWGARVVEYFELLAATQYLGHLRPHCLATADLRDGAALAARGGPFERLRHTVDVRRIESGRGRFNIPNIGIFLWRLRAFRHSASPAVRVDARRWLASPLGQPLPLFTHPRAEDEIAHLAEPINVPAPIQRPMLAADPALYYGTRATPDAPLDNAEPSLVLFFDGVEVPRAKVVACNLADVGGAWVHEPPAGRVAVDPELGRIALAADLPAPTRVAVTYYDGFSAALGGGEYARTRSADPQGTTLIQVPAEQPTIAAALAAFETAAASATPETPRVAAIEIGDSGRYEEALAIQVPPGWALTIRAAAERRPALILPGALAIAGGAGSTLTLDGLLIAGGALQVPDETDNGLVGLALVHATLVPGIALAADGAPREPLAASLVVAREGVAVTLDHAITGAIALAEGSRLAAADSIIDATDPTHRAFGAPAGGEAGGTLSLAACTLIGRVDALAVGLVANSLLYARAAASGEPAVQVRRRQDGCVRFSYLPTASRVPHPHRCQSAPEPAWGAAAAAAPCFTSGRYGTPGYCQLTATTPEAIRTGADDEGEMGAFHALFPAQREANLRVRLQEHLRAGLAAGIFYAS